MPIRYHYKIPVRWNKWSGHEEGDFSYFVWMKGDQVEIPEVIHPDFHGLSKNKRYAVIVIEEDKLIKETV